MLRFAKLRRGASADVKMPPLETQATPPKSPAPDEQEIDEERRSSDVAPAKKSLRALIWEKARHVRKQSTDGVPAASSTQSASSPSSSVPQLQNTDIPSDDIVEVKRRAKDARRKARRAERERKEEEWKEENRQRFNQSKIYDLPYEPLPPLSNFDSASEDERDPVRSLSQTHRHLQSASSTNPSLPSDAAPMLDIAQALPSNRNTDAQLAELFAAQALTGNNPSTAVPSASAEATSPNHSTAAPNGSSTAPIAFSQGGHARRLPTQPAPIGWGDAYDTAPSQPLYGTPAHLAQRGPTTVDPSLAEKINRGRQLAFLAIEQEEQGNMGAAEAGYMKALSLLVPASKELDIGSELNKNARLSLKAKVQREASAMLDKCEQLRLFLKATAPTVPTDVPNMPTQNSTSYPTRPRNSSPPRTDRRSFDEDPVSPDSAVLPPRVETRTRSPKKSQRHIPPPPPPSFQDDPRELIQRLEHRKNVLSAASDVFPSAPNASVLHKPRQSVPKRLETYAKCFMCKENAHLKTPCNHAFCSICGNQTVSVFGKCPVPGCNTRLTTESFIHIAP
ncbi:hypothetical protein BWQ96_06354 [Gracilariopsis chorda]|uniref:RING-type domain-containing protein n=1 Tax=Gracilariopsis chorda TaxID=448386 RepID=A0A2V3IP84_9FLOR|nr:hypothetical protein BWQ96_06354 [Gracilariopsis chorda]|eukprot:PXF43888.1 hypothetical protein BWQ96_06354 [Gracilariopsis chorda]